MTAPGPHGYPDWNRVSAAVDTLILNTGATVTAASPTNYDGGFVGNYNAIGFFMNNTGQVHNVEFQFFEDAAFTVSFTTYEVITNANATIARRIIPVLGPYLRVSVGTPVLGGTHNIRVWSAQRPAIPDGGNAQDNVLISRTAQNIAAGAAETRNAQVVYPGSAMWTVTSSSTAWRARLEAVTTTGTFVVIDSMEGGIGQTDSHLVFLPFAAVRVVYTNNGALAANYDTYLLARPVESGA